METVPSGITQKLTIRFAAIAASAALVGCLFTDEATASDLVTWKELPPLPPSPGNQIQPGVAGPFVGTHAEALIVAGGANFPQAPPWESGPKVWWNDVFVMLRNKESKSNKFAWSENTWKLPRALGYGVSINLEDGLLCIGGCDGEKCYAESFLLQWDSADKEIKMLGFPSLPKPLAFMTGARVGNMIILAGGQETMDPGLPTSTCYGLNLDNREDEAAFKWEELPAWEGSPRVMASSTAQSDGTTECFYLFSGRNPNHGKPTEVLRDAHKFNPQTKSWTPLGEISNSHGPISVMAAATCAAPGGNKVAVIGGADGVLMSMLEHNGLKVRSKNKEESDAFMTFNHTLLASHPGFSRRVLCFDTVQKTWTEAGNFPTGCPVTSPAVMWDDSVIIASGEIRPGVRTPRVWIGSFDAKPEP